MTTKPYKLPPVSGCLYDANASGFGKLLVEANRVVADGYELVTVVRLDSKIAGVFRRRAKGPQSGGFFE